PSPGYDLTLREEIVAFGTSATDSGIRLTVGATNASTSAGSVTIGTRWQIDYENGDDDGPLFATVTCNPPTVVEQLDVEHELAPGEIQDFYRIQNNDGFPIFANVNSTTSLSGFPDTGTPDRLIFAAWPSAVGSAW